MKNIILLVVLFSLSASTYSCAQSKSTQKEQFQMTYKNSKTLVKSHTFDFVGELVYDNKSREKLKTNSNTISIIEAKISGEVTSLSHQNKSFNISGDKENYKAVFDDEQQNISIALV